MEIIYRVYEISDDNGYKDKTILDQQTRLQLFGNERDFIETFMKGE